jgi:trans-aconitate 2-methyltransferase
MPTTWDPDKYLRFGDERTRPSIDLVSRILIDNPKTIIDLGCGPGNSTRVLRQRWPHARLCGIDSSPDMIAAACQAHPDQEWTLGSIEDWSGDATFDLVFSSAALQWVRGHTGLMRRLFARVASGGALAFTIPSGGYSLVRKFIHEIADDASWASRMNEARCAVTMEEPHVYYDALAPLAHSVDIWETEYYHVMESPAAIVQWVSSTGLRPFLDVLDSDDERNRFVAALNERVAESYPRHSDGRVLFPFKRVFVVAYA